MPVNSTTRRDFLKLGLAGGGAIGLAGISGRAALAQTFPARATTILLPVTAGGSMDSLMRIAEPAISQALGHKLLIDYKPGGNTAIAASAVARAAPDGYTLVTHTSGMALLPYTQQIDFDPVKSFTFIIGQHSFPAAAVVKADSKYKTLDDLVAAAKATPGKITVGTTGITTSGHLALEGFKKQGIEFLMVTYKGADYLPALLGGHVEAIFAGPNWMASVDGGQARALAVFDEKRPTLYPNVPTAKELGFPIVEAAYVGIAGPAGMDPGVVKVLREAFAKGHHSPEFIAALPKFLALPWDVDADQFREFVAKKVETNKQLAADLNLKPAQ